MRGGLPYPDAAKRFAVGGSLISARAHDTLQATMKVRTIRFILLGLLLLLLVGIVVLEAAARLGWRPRAALAVRHAVPYYPVTHRGPLLFEDIVAADPIPDEEPDQESRPSLDERPGQAQEQERDQVEEPEDEHGEQPPGPEEQDEEEDSPGWTPSFPSEKTWKRWEKYQVTFKLSWTFANPYDPDEIAVDAFITTPSGARETVPAFWYVPCENRIGERDLPTKDPNDPDTPMVEYIEQKPKEGTWMLRYTPREEGTYTYRLLARTPTASAYSYDQTFTVRGRLGSGFARVSRRDRRYFEFDDGSFFFPIGQNVAWADDMGSADFALYMANMEKSGANWARVWLTSYFKGQTIEWSWNPKQPYYHGLGFYSAEVAWKLDRMLETAAEHGVYLMWCVQQHGQFSTRYNSCWAENPYNRAAGGFLDEPEQFFLHPRARELFKKRMRYYIARYGYSPHLFAWELWNEVALTDGFSEPVVTAWHKEMGDYIKRLDPTGRMITTSYGSPFYGEAFELDSHDFIQTHIYHVDPTEFAAWRVRSIEGQMGDVARRKRPGKPILIGEYGLGHDPKYARIDEDSVWPVDPCGLHVHNSLWIGLLSGSAGTAMNWWWDKYIDKNNLYFHFKGISRFLAGEDLRRWGLEQVKLFDDAYRTPEFIAYVLLGPDRAYGWVFETAYTIKDFAPTGREREDVKIALDSLNDGDCWIEFWDTYDGVPIARIRRTVEDGAVEFTVPPFRGDVAFKLFRGRPKAVIEARIPEHDRMIEELRKLAERFGR